MKKRRKIDRIMMSPVSSISSRSPCELVSCSSLLTPGSPLPHSFAMEASHMADCQVVFIAGKTLNYTTLDSKFIPLALPSADFSQGPDICIGNILQPLKPANNTTRTKEGEKKIKERR